MTAPIRDMLEAALALAGRGRPVFPCNRDKSPRTLRGHLDATTDAGQIRALWRSDPRALIGMPTGAASGVVVVDLDVKERRDGMAAWGELRAGRAVPPTREVRTASGGRHIYFECPTGRTVRCSQSRLALGVDVRGDGGYVIVPPSGGYVVVERAVAAPLPAWLLAVLDPPPEPPRPARSQPAPAVQRGGADRRFEAVLRVVEDAPEGTRHHRLYWASCRCGEMVAAGELDEALAVPALVAAAMAAGGRDKRNAQNTARDGIRRGREGGPRA